jgi:hypothetical protein
MKIPLTLEFKKKKITEHLANLSHSHEDNKDARERNWKSPLGDVGFVPFKINSYFNRLFPAMKPLFVIVVLAFVMSCSKQDSVDQLFPHEEHALSLASVKCQCSADKLPWLRDMIRQADADDRFKGTIYAIETTKGVAFLHQPWLSSCFGCLLYDCDGDKLTANGSVMNEIVGGAVEANIIYTSH